MVGWRRYKTEGISEEVGVDGVSANGKTLVVRGKASQAAMRFVAAFDFEFISDASTMVEGLHSLFPCLFPELLQWYH